MANMSYCRFENTYQDMSDCVGHMRHSDSMEEMDLNTYEAAAIRQLAQECQDFLEEYNRLTYTEEESQ